ncbi:MAG: hypothetical protein MR743_08235 [Oscillospiraceae bacterium]|nr:hypothetical protein [Oscillospiraceae bacterium]
MMREEDTVFTADEESKILMRHLRESYNDAQNRITALQNDVADLVHILQTNDIPVPEGQSQILCKR